MLQWVFILSLFADDGISIPCSYTSYLCPVQSSKLYNEVRLCKEKDKHALNHFETPYVVHLQNKFQLAPTQPLFTFCHPNKGKIYVSCSFSVIFFLKEIRAVLVKLTYCESYVYWTVHHLDSWVKRDQLDVTCFIISLFNAQHVSDVTTSILRSLRLMCWVISWVTLIWYDVCWSYVVVWLVPQLAYGYHTTTTKPQRNTNTHRTRAIQPMK